MHIPDGFISAPVGIAAGILSAAGVGYAIARTDKTLPRNRTALLGLSAAFVFAAQMLNFPVINGTSGHLVGAALAGALIGPSAAVIAMTAVLIVQCFMFADGGITALGANLFNMAILGVVASYAVYRALLTMFGQGRVALAVSAGVAGWASTVLASLACAGEVSLSGKVQASMIVPAMLFTHILIGIGEGLITALVIASLASLRPEMLKAEDAPPASAIGPTLVFGLLISLGLAIFVSPFACPWPDGLEKVAQRLGFDGAAIEPLVPGIMPDYTVTKLGESGLSTALAGAVGTLAVFAIVMIAVRLLALRKSEPATART